MKSQDVVLKSALVIMATAVMAVGVILALRYSAERSVVPPVQEAVLVGGDTAPMSADIASQFAIEESVERIARTALEAVQVDTPSALTESLVEHALGVTCAGQAVEGALIIAYASGHLPDLALVRRLAAIPGEDENVRLAVTDRDGRASIELPRDSSDWYAIAVAGSQVSSRLAPVRVSGELAEIVLHCIGVLAIEYPAPVFGSGREFLADSQNPMSMRRVSGGGVEIVSWSNEAGRLLMQLAGVETEVMETSERRAFYCFESPNRESFPHRVAISGRVPGYAPFNATASVPTLDAGLAFLHVQFEREAAGFGVLEIAFNHDDIGRFMAQSPDAVLKLQDAQGMVSLEVWGGNVQKLLVDRNVIRMVGIPSGDYTVSVVTRFDAFEALGGTPVSIPPESNVKIAFELPVLSKVTLVFEGAALPGQDEGILDVIDVESGRTLFAPTDGRNLELGWQTRRSIVCMYNSLEHGTWAFVPSERTVGVIATEYDADSLYAAAERASGSAEMLALVEQLTVTVGPGDVVELHPIKVTSPSTENSAK